MSISATITKSVEEPAEALPKLAFSIPQAGQIIGVSDVTIRRLLRRGKLRSLTSLRHKIIPLDEINRFLKSDLKA